MVIPLSPVVPGCPGDTVPLSPPLKGAGQGTTSQSSSQSSACLAPGIGSEVGPWHMVKTRASAGGTTRVGLSLVAVPLCAPLRGLHRNPARVLSREPADHESATPRRSP